MRAAATRGFRSNGKALLTGTWIKGFVTDIFWSAGWLMGFGSPMWPFPYNGGSARFVEQFGTFEYITKEFANTLQTGRRQRSLTPVKGKTEAQVTLSCTGQYRAAEVAEIEKQLVFGQVQAPKKRRRKKRRRVPENQLSLFDMVA